VTDHHTTSNSFSKQQSLLFRSYLQPPYSSSVVRTSTLFLFNTNRVAQTTQMITGGESKKHAPFLTIRSPFTAYQMPPILRRTDTSRERALNRVLGHMDGPWTGSPGLRGLACYSYPPGILSCSQSIRDTI
jgi:hypothetical protein